MNQMSNPNRIVVEGVQKMTPSEAFIETLVSLALPMYSAS